MGLQLIFAVETNRKCKSDWIYIRDTIDRFYEYENTRIKLTPVYMDGKGKYQKKQSQIQSYISQYASTSRENDSRVIYCFDCDNYDTRPEDKIFLDGAKEFCRENEYDFVWFCKDIEDVYLGRRIADKQKKDESAKFRRDKKIENIERNRLSAETFRPKASNICKVLDKYLDKKSI